MTTIGRIHCLLLTGVALACQAARADEVSLTSEPVSALGLKPDPVASDLMPVPIYRFAVQSIAFSPNGRTLASGDGYGNLRLWDTAKGALRATVKAHEGWVFSIAWFSDGKRFATGGKDRLIGIRDSADPARLLKTLSGHEADVHAVAITANGATLVSSSDDKTVRVWNANSAQTLHVLRGHERQISTVTLSPDGRFIASGSRDQTIRVWNLKAGNEAGVLRGHLGAVMSVQFSPNGRLLASASYDRSVRLWDMKTMTPLTVLTGHTARAFSVAFSPNGKQLASAGDRTARLWDVATGANVRTFKLDGKMITERGEYAGTASAVAYSPDGKKLAVGSTLGTVHLVSLKTGALLHTLTPPTND